MKRLWIVLMLAISGTAAAQSKVDDERMTRDIEVAENVLSTVIKQQFDRKSFFPMDVEGSYTPGYGVTFRMPNTFGNSFFMFENAIAPAVVGRIENEFRFERLDDEDLEREIDREGQKRKNKVVTVNRYNNDSVRAIYNQRVIKAAQEFILDYGDLLSQLPADEKIMITNRGEGQTYYFNRTNNKRYLLTVEGTKSDLQQYKLGKLTRDQAMGKLKVVNTEATEDMHPDLELLSSIFNRLYRPDLSKTYYTQESIHYERLKDFGAIYYMRVYSSSEQDNQRWRMPTLQLDNLTQDERDKKVKELYPQFEKELKQHLLEYGRTVKSLGDDEMLVFNVRLTKCEKCGIPASVELAVKGGVLKEVGTGKLSQDAALARVSVKKSGVQ